jgi:signal transduction histidine kinase
MIGILIGFVAARVGFYVSQMLIPLGCWIMLTLATVSLGVLFFVKLSRRQELQLHQVRKRIAIDLHDDIGSSLSQVAILCEVLSRRANAERESLQEIAGVSRNVLASMSEIVWAVDPKNDRLCDLTQRMRWFAGETLSGRGVGLDFASPDSKSDIHLDAETRRQVFLIFKESINNIVRHAGANRAKVVLRIEDNCLWLIVEDDGRGFDTAKAVSGNGLRNITHRARLMRANCETRSQEGGGTVVALRVPLPDNSNDWRHQLRMAR